MFSNFRNLTILTILTTNFLFAQSDQFFESKSSFSGYGELHYNQNQKEKESASKTLDFHRFVMFFGYSWTEKWSFKSEIELEHNFVQKGEGELELEQAYVNYHHADWFGFQVGVVLPSVGLINEYHEPPLFFGVERPDYHNKIIPTTWFGNGMAFYGTYNFFDYKLTIMEGLNSDKFSESSGIRNGRLKGFKANAKNLLYNLRIDYLGVAGLKIGGSYTFNKATGETSTNKISLLEFHSAYHQRNFYSVFEIGNISYEKGNLESSFGYYFDIGYNISDAFNCDTKIIPFFRYSDYNTAAKTKTGGDSEKKNHFTYWMIGLSVKPIPQIVFKLDYGTSTKELGNEKTKLFNLGIGYMF
ncbi:MAG: hypothetical protein FJ214_10445 [Ignavibacteria bacterium]|nr:hypothetical protein [Ignavibacteria bacterium]